MLLVKSKELKNLNKKRPLSPVSAGLLTLCGSFLPHLSIAQAETNSPMSVETGISVFLSLIVVIAIIFALAYIVRRFNVAQAGNGQMRVVASMMAGTKEKVMVIEVGNEQHLLGITAHNINHLAKLEQPIVNENKAKVGWTNQQQVGAQDNGQTANGFQQKLVQAMAQAMTGKSKKGEKNV